EPEQDAGVWIWDIAKTRATRVTPAWRSTVPVWSPDGRSIAFVSNGVQRQAADGTGVAEPLITGNLLTFPDTFTRDGKSLVVQQPDPKAQWDLKLVPLQGNHEPSALLANPSFNELLAEFSPDGHWIAYQSDESGTEEIYIRPFPRVDGGRWQISAGG